MTEQNNTPPTPNGFKRVTIGDILTPEQLESVIEIINSNKGDIEVTKELRNLFDKYREQLEAKGFDPGCLAHAVFYHRQAFRRNS